MIKAVRIVALLMTSCSNEPDSKTAIDTRLSCTSRVVCNTVALRLGVRHGPELAYTFTGCRCDD